jgi:tetratricopeptide (TPR) repeat protein
MLQFSSSLIFALLLASTLCCGLPGSSAAADRAAAPAGTGQMQRSSSHLVAQGAAAASGKSAEPSGWQEVFDAGAGAKLAGRYPEAERLLKRAVELAEPFGESDRRLADSRLLLGGVYLRTSRLTEAEDMYKKVLPVYEKSDGPESTVVGILLDNLAQVYDAQGKLAEGERLHNQSLVILEKTLGPNSVDFAMNLANLSGVYHRQRKYDKAEELLKRAISIEEKLPGAEKQLATSLDNLASVYYEQDRLADAEPIRRRALAIYETALGPYHHETGICLNNLAALCARQGKFREASSLYDRAAQALSKSLGPDSPEVRSLMKNRDFARLLEQQAQGQADQAQTKPRSGQRKP